MALSLKHLHTPHAVTDLLPLPSAVVSDYREETVEGMLRWRDWLVDNRKATITPAELISKRVAYARRVARANENLERLDAVIEAMVAGAYLDEPVDEPGPEQAELDLDTDATSDAKALREAYDKLEKYVTNKDRVSVMTVSLQTKVGVRAAKVLAERYAHVQFDESNIAEPVMIVGRLSMSDESS